MRREKSYNNNHHPLVLLPRRGDASEGQIEMTTSTPMESNGQLVNQRAEAMVAAAARTLPAAMHRSTADQRQAFLEHLYSDYADLHAQQGEIHERKNQMDFDMFESNQQDIHDVLFANAEVAEGALGDWDTWERVEAAMKRYAYGRPRYTAEEHEEASAMRSRIAALDAVVQERGSAVQSLTEALAAAQLELGAALKLLHLRENEIRTLSSQQHMTTLQLRYAQRENLELRGLRSENEPSQLKQDLGYLIEANRRLEAENRALRNRQRVAADVEVSLAPPTAAPSSLPEEKSGAFVPLQAPLSPADSDALDRCLSDDAFRQQYLQKEVPVSGAVLGAKRETAQWKRRLEAEVSSAMHMLDRDAAELFAPAPQSPASPHGVGGAAAAGVAFMQNGVFVSYASHGTAALLPPQQSVVPLLRAPTITRDSPATSTDASATQPAAAAVPLTPLARRKSKMEKADTSKARRKSSTTTSKKRGSVAHGGSSVGPQDGKTKVPTAAPTRQRTSAVSAAVAPAFTHLRSAILQSAELSRANAVRRELLHVAQLRQLLADELARVALREETPTDGAPHAPSTNAPAELPARAGQDAAAGRVELPTPGAATLAGEDEMSGGDATALPAPERLRQKVQESRSPSVPLLSPSAALAGADGGEASSSAAERQQSVPAGGATPAEPIVRTPTPPPMSRPPSRPCRSGGAERPPSNAARVSAVRGSADQVTGALSAAPHVPLPSLVPLLHETRDVRASLAVLRGDVVAYWEELREAFALLAEVLQERQLEVAHAAEDVARTAVMEETAAQVMEEAALQRTAQILRSRFGAMLPNDVLAPMELSESATDEEWLVNELRAAAAAMVKESLQDHAQGGPGTAQDGAAEAPSRVGAAEAPRMPRPPRPPLADEDFFESEILRPFRLAPGFASDAAAARDHHSRVMDGDAFWEGSSDGGGDAAVGSGAGSPAPRRAAGGVDVRARRQPAPPASWHWRPRNTAAPPDGVTDDSRVRTQLRHPLTHTAVPLAAAMQAAQQLPGTDVRAIQPTVLRYVLGGGAARSSGSVAARLEQQTAYVYGSAFEGFVQQYIVPIISAAGGITSGGRMNAALRAAVQELRQEERMRRKRGVRLLFDRVANNIRTRRLLKRTRYQGEAFASYVGLLYSNWRKKLERDRRHLQDGKNANRDAVFSLLNIQPSSAGGATAQHPAAARGKGEKRAPLLSSTKSSYHFDRANFDGKH